MLTSATQGRDQSTARAGRVRFSFGFQSLQPLSALVDTVLLLAAGTLSHFLYVTPHPFPSAMFGLVIIATTIFVCLSYLTQSYQEKSSGPPRRTIFAALWLWVVTLCFLALGGFLLKIGAQFSRVSVVTFAVLGAGLIVADRAAWPALMRYAVERGLIFVTRVLVLRISADAVVPSDEEQEIARLRRSGLHPVAVKLISPADDDLWQQALNFIGHKVQSRQIEEIVILADDVPLAAVEAVAERLRVVPLPVRFVLDARTCQLLGRNLSKAGDCVLAEYQRAPLTRSERFGKRVLDVTLAMSGLLLLSPLFIIIAVMIRLDSPGPVLFRQFRRGFGGTPFTILKFRSMTVADNGSVVVQAQRNDLRVTRMGRLIRRTSIDELPQLFNVLRGEMSIVGPRPHALAHDDYYARLIEEYAFRHHAKPGLTGWAQVQGLRGETPEIENMKARVEKDIWYVENWSLWLDIAIIARTMLVVLKQKSAY